MADHTVPNAGCDPNSVRNAACIHTKKIFDSCQSKDCIEDLRVYLTCSSQEVLNNAQSVKGGRATLVTVLVSLDPLHMNRGFYSVNMTYFYQIDCEAYTGCARPVPITGLAVFGKRAILFGSECTTKLFVSDSERCDKGNPTISIPSSNPDAVVETVDPILLDAYIRTPCGQPDLGCSTTSIPKEILALFDEPLTMSSDPCHALYVTLGQFSILRLERDVHLMLPIYDCCIPDKECNCDICDNDPCELFQKVQFPVEQFCPPCKSCDLDPLDEFGCSKTK